MSNKYSLEDIMKRMQKFVALILAALMFSAVICASGMKVDAIDQGGIQQTDDYTVGVDLSVWNVGGSSVMDYTAVDFAKMKADGCDFAILRMGFEGSKTKEDTLDLAFIEYYNRARAAGMKLGAYFFSRATTYEGAKQDAEWAISVIEENNMYFEYPICYDVEADVHYAMGDSALNTLCFGWCETMEANGYYPAVYINKQLYPKLTSDFKGKYDVWYRYILSDNEFATQYNPATLNISSQCSLWQYTMYQRFDGCSYKYTGQNQVDGNVSYKDYASIMAANNYNNWELKPEDAPSAPESSDSSDESAFTESESEDTVSDSNSEAESEEANVSGAFILILCILGGIVVIAIVIIVVILVVTRKKKQ